MVRQLSLVDVLFAAVCGVPGPALQAWRHERAQPSPAAAANVVSLELYRRAKAAGRR